MVWDWPRRHRRRDKTSAKWAPRRPARSRVAPWPRSTRPRSSTRKWYASVRRDLSTLVPTQLINSIAQCCTREWRRSRPSSRPFCTASRKSAMRSGTARIASAIARTSCRVPARTTNRRASSRRPWTRARSRALATARASCPRPSASATASRRSCPAPASTSRSRSTASRRTASTA